MLPQTPLIVVQRPPSEPETVVADSSSACRPTATFWVSNRLSSPAL